MPIHHGKWRDDHHGLPQAADPPDADAPAAAGDNAANL